MNTVWELIVTDSEAFRVAIEGAHGIDQASELDIHGKISIEVIYSRQAHNPMGFHLGTETVVFSFPCFKREDLGLSGFPKELNEYVVIPKMYIMDEINCPDSEECENGCEDGECDCELYFEPDEDFFCSEMDNIVDSLGKWKAYPEAEFDSDERMWSIGDKEYELDDKEEAHEYIRTGESES